jgi:hypothetical protein
MKNQRLLAVAALVLALHPTQAQSNMFCPQEAELFNLLRKHPAESLFLASDHVQCVNDRYEPCCHKKEVRYMRVITPADDAYTVRVVGPHGNVVMRGSYADAYATVPNGEFVFYDDAGTLRAQGRYVNGIKSGTWQRYDDRGQALPPKEYDGLGWDARQVKLGLAAESRYLGDLATQ